LVGYAPIILAYEELIVGKRTDNNYKRLYTQALLYILF